MHLACPACQGGLHELELGESRAFACDACRGVWFDWFDGETSALSQKLDTHVVRAAPPVRAGESRCPRDAGVLVEQPYLDTGPRVFRCGVCLGLFAPRDRIAALQSFHERLPEGGSPIVTSSLLARIWNAFGG
jgi:ferredoxin